MKSFKPLVFAPLLLLAACSANLTTDAFPDFSDTRELKVSSDPLSGEVNANAWKIGRAVARINPNGEYSVAMAGEGVAMSCSNTFPMAPHITFVIPGAGSYPYASSAGADQRLVNFIFPYSTATTGGSNNVLASKSLIQIDSIQGGVMNGHLAALSPVGAEHSYSIGGKFQATVCNNPADMPMFIRQKGSTAFRLLYAEAVKVAGGASYDVRMMDHVPMKKCNSWDAWMMTETPIKYLSVRVPNAVGAFAISEGVMEYGDQRNSGGWSTEAFNGSGKVLGLSASEILISFKATDFASMGFEIEGALTTTICAQ